MNEVLMGRPFLKEIGFNLKEHLSGVYSLINNKHVDDLENENIKLATVKYQGLSYESADDDPIEQQGCLTTGFGEDSKESIDYALKETLKNARENGISDQGLQRLTNLLKEHRKIIRIKLGADAPANFVPLRITPTKDAKPFRSPQRRYAPLHREFISNTVRELEAVGAIYKNPSSRWASPALAVPKPGSNNLRFTVDL